MADLAALEPTSKFAIVTIVTDNFIGLGATFVASLKQHLRHHDRYDLLVLTNAAYAPLSQANRDLLTAIYGKVHFIEVPADHLNADNTRRYDADGQVIGADTDAALPTKRAVYIKLSLLLLPHYVRCVWLDSDMLALADFSELFTLPHGIAVVPAGPPDPRFGVGFQRLKPHFNSGVMALGTAYRGEKLFAQAVDILNSRRLTVLQDQSVLNRLYEGQHKLYLPHTYNWKMVPKISPDFREEHAALASAKIVHFVAGSKWRLADPIPGSPLAERFHQIRNAFGIPLIIQKTDTESAIAG